MLKIVKIVCASIIVMSFVDCPASNDVSLPLSFDRKFGVVKAAMIASFFKVSPPLA